MPADSNPKVSIVIVVLNAVKTIEAAIISVMNQDYPNYELIILDGISTDGTIEAIKKYQNNIKYFNSEKDSGIYDAMNKSIKRCTGDWIYFLGADDKLHNNEVLSSVFATTYKENSIIYGNAYYTHRQKVRFGNISRYAMSKHNINHQTIFYPRQLFNNYKYDLRFKVVADYYLNLQLYFNSNYHFKFVNLIISDFNDRGTSGTVADHQFDYIKESLFKKIFPTDVFVFYKLRRLFIRIRNKA